MTTTRWRPSYAELKNILLDRLPEALYHMFPAGKIDGKHFKIGNTRGDEGDSLVVERDGEKAGLWHDFTTGEGGDILTLWAEAHKWDSHRNYWDIVDSIQTWARISPTDQGELARKGSSAYGTSTPRSTGPALPTRASPPQPAHSRPSSSKPLGSPSGKWLYTDREGNPLVWSYRYDTGENEKEFRYQDAITGEWKAPCPRPLFNQPGMTVSDTVVLVEGEKCAEFLNEFGVCATTAMNGASTPMDKTDWSPLRGKHVIIWPDHDTPGKTYADKLIQKFRDPKLEIASLKLVIVPADKPEKWDAANAIAEETDPQTFLETHAREVSLTPEPGSLSGQEGNAATLLEPPLPLRKKPDNPKDYPIEALGDLLGGAALDIHDDIQAPLAICAQSVLANAALAIQAHLDVRLPFGQSVPTSLYLVSISESGGRKSSSDKRASEFICQREKELAQKYAQDMAAYINKKEVYDALRRKILQGKAIKQKESWELELQALGAPPVPPITPLLTVPEPTYEGICCYYVNGQPSLGLFSDEGGQFLSGHGMNAENKIKTAAGLCRLWGGEKVKRMRSGDGTTILPGKRLSMHLMLQNMVVEPLLSDTQLLQQGLLARLLVVYPSHLFGTRFSTNPKTRDGSMVKEFNDRMLDIARQPLPIDPEAGYNVLKPRVLEMTPEAEAAFYEFSDHIEGRLKDGYDMESLRGFCSKLGEQASRIAAVIAYAENPNVSYLQKSQFDRGAILAEYYATEALRLFGNASLPKYIQEAETLLDWLKNSWPSRTGSPEWITVRDVCIFGPNKIRRKAPAAKALQTLEDHGWLVREADGATIDGKRHKDIWRIRKEFF